jgi:hypothetical protein
MPNRENKTVFREAKLTDVLNASRLFERQLISEAESLGEDMNMPDIKQWCLDRIARAVVSPTAHILVGERSGRIVSLFGAEIANMYPYRNEPSCVFFAAFQKKQYVNILEVFRSIEDWAREQGCSNVVIETPAKNEIIQGLMDKLKKTEPYTITYKYDIIEQEEEESDDS